MEIPLSKPERERLRRYAEELGMSEEEALTHAARAELEERYRLPTRSGRVVPFKGLKSDEAGDPNG